MMLYHGTSGTIAIHALKHGLNPRATHGASNWKHSVESNASCVYFSECYAPYFAFSAAENNGDGAWGIVEVDTSRLSESKFWPDEDFLEQATRQNAAWQQQLAGLSMTERTRQFQSVQAANRALWRDSLNTLGTCAHHGAVPAKAITRVSIFDPASNYFMAHAAAEPTITLANHKICAPVYRLMTKWFFGESIPIWDWIAAANHLPGCDESIVRPLAQQLYGSQFDNYITQTRHVLAAQNGIVVHRGRARPKPEPTQTQEA